MAGFAHVAALAFGELTVVGIRFVAIRTKLVGYRRLEIPAAVTGCAIYRTMLTAQREVSFIVIKLRAYAGRRHLLPPAGYVAGLARVLKGAMVWVGVAVFTRSELQSPVPRSTARPNWEMAYGANHLGMETRQRIPCLGVVEPADVLPGRVGMTGLAVFAELSLVKILMAREARWRKTDEAPVQVFVFDQAPPFWLDVASQMAILAFNSRVLAVQEIAGLGMVESLLGRLPTDHLKVHPVVIGMAARAIFVPILPLHHHGMKPQILCESLVDFRVALQALEAGAQDGEFVAGRALAYAGEGFVGSGKGPR
jgi:hypothetical protein